MDRIRSVGGVVIGPSKKVIVVSQHGTSWSLIKGTVEQGEDDITTARREFKEEAGITDIKFIKPLGRYERFTIGIDGSDDKSRPKSITMYLCTTSEEVLEPEDPENPEAIWVEPTKVADQLTHRKDKEFYKSVEQEVLEFIKDLENS